MARHRVNTELKQIAEAKNRDELDDTIEVYQKIEDGDWEKIRIKRLQK